MAVDQIVGIGLDLIDLRRFEILYGADEPDLLARCFTPAEITQAGQGKDRFARLAAWFAAKEALYKALGGAAGTSHTDIEVTHGESGEPSFVLQGAIKKAADRKGVKSLHLSITHSDASAAAVVIAIRRP